MAAQKKNTKTNNNSKPAQKNLLRFRFMVTSKFIGMMAFVFIAVIITFCMYEMHRSMDYSSMPQLIVSAFGFAGVYAGFYLTMAKIEHAEEEKTRREVELAKLKEKAGVAEVTPEDLEAARQEINELRNPISGLLGQPNTTM